MKIDAISSTLKTSGASIEAPIGVAKSTAATSRTVGGTDGDFATMLSNAIGGMAQQIRNAETVSIAGMNGTARVQDVVEQVMAAEQTLQASIAVRDKIVAAYLEISRMAI